MEQVGSPPAGRRSARHEPLPPMLRRLAVVATLAATADWYVSFALFWIAAVRGYSGLQIAGLVIAARAPTFVGGMVGGRLVDAFGSRRMIRIETMLRAGLLGLLALLALSGDDGYVALVLVAAGCSLCAPVTYVGSRALTPTLVGVSQLGRANTLLSLADQLPIVLSAALAGPALTWLGPGAFAVPAVLVVVAWWLARGLAKQQGRPLVATLDGEPAAAPRHYPRAVLALITLSTLYFFAYGPFQPLLPVLVKANLGGDATTFALLRICVGVGSLAGLALAPYLTDLDRPGLVNSWGVVVYGAVMLPLVFAHSAVWAMLIYFLSGIVWGPYAAIEATALQKWTEPGQHGRIFGLQRALNISAIPAGGAIGSAAVDGLGVTAVLAGSALLCCVVGLLGLAYAPLRRKA